MNKRQGTFSPYIKWNNMLDFGGFFLFRLILSLSLESYKASKGGKTLTNVSAFVWQRCDSVAPQAAEHVLTLQVSDWTFTKVAGSETPPCFRSGLHRPHIVSDDGVLTAWPPEDETVRSPIKALSPLIAWKDSGCSACVCGAAVLLLTRVLMSGLLLWDPPPSPRCSSFKSVFWQQQKPPSFPPIAPTSTMNDKGPVLSTRPIVLQTAQVMINTNTQQWELQRAGQCGSRESLRRDVHTPSLPPRHEVSGDRCQRLSEGKLSQTTGRVWE